MNKYREERIEMIAAMMMAIANISEEMAFELLKSTITYQNIVDGEECTLYESYSANLEDVVEELQECDKGALVKAVTEDAVTELNKWMLDKGIKNAKQLKENIDTMYATLTVMPSKKVSNPKPIPFEVVVVENKNRRKGAKMYCGGVAGKAAKTLETQKKVGRAVCKAKKNSSIKKNDSGWRAR